MSNPILSTPASSGGSSTPSLNPGTLTYDVSKYGAVAGSSTATLNVALKNILAAAPANTYIEMFIPGNASAWQMSGPLVCPQYYFSVRGEGRGLTTVDAANGNHGFLMGFPTNYGYIPIASDHWPDMYLGAGATFGMDSSYVTALAQKYGFRFYSPATGLAQPDFQYIAATDSGFSQGVFSGTAVPTDFWTQTNKFTLECAVNFQIPGFAPGAASHGPNSPAPGFGCGFPNLANYSNTRTWAWQTEGWSGTVSSSTATVTALTINSQGNNNTNVGSVGAIATIVSGLGAGQHNYVSSLVQVGATWQYTFQNAWATIPDTTSYIQIFSGVSVRLNIADTPLDDGRVPGLYDPCENGGTYEVGFNVPSGLLIPPNGTWRFKVQVDLTASTTANLAQAWISSTGSAAADFIAMPLNASAAVLPLANPYFVECSFGVFQLGYSSGSYIGNQPQRGGSSPSQVVAYNTAPNGLSLTTIFPCWDGTLLGFSLIAGNAGGNVYSTAVSLALNPSGPRPAGTINDSFSYNPSGVTGLIGYYTFTDPGQSDAQGGMFMTSQHTMATCNSFVMPMIATFSLGSNLSISDLTINNNTMLGAGILIGANYGLTINRVNTIRFYSGIGHAITEDAYPVIIRDANCQFAANGIYLYRCISQVHNLTLNYNRCALRVVGGNMVGVTMFIAQGPGFHQIRVHGSNALGFDVQGIVIDQEGVDGGMSVAAVDFDQGPLSATGLVRLTDFSSAFTNFGRPQILLRCNPAFLGKIQTLFVLDTVNCGNVGAAMVQVTGGNHQWFGEIKNIFNFSDPPDFDQTPILDCTFTPSQTGIAVTKPLVGVPSTGTWTAGLTKIPILAEGLLPGMPLEFICVTSGKYGSKNGAPVWAAFQFNDVDGTGNALAGMTFREDSVACTFSGA